MNGQREILNFEHGNNAWADSYRGDAVGFELNERPAPNVGMRVYAHDGMVSKFNVLCQQVNENVNF